MSSPLYNPSSYQPSESSFVNPVEAYRQQPAYGTTPGLSHLFRTLDFLGNTARTTLYGLMEDDWNPALANLKVWNPLTNENYVSGRKLLDSLGIDPDGAMVVEDVPIIGKFDMGDFLAQVVTDPIMFLTAGATGAGKAAATRAARVASEALTGIVRGEEVATRSMQAAQITKKAGDVLDPFQRAELFLQEFGDNGAKYVADGMEAKLYNVRGDVMNGVKGRINPDMLAGQISDEELQALKLAKQERLSDLRTIGYTDDKANTIDKLHAIFQDPEAHKAINVNDLGDLLSKAADDRNVLGGALMRDPKMRELYQGALMNPEFQIPKAAQRQYMEGLRGIRFGIPFTEFETNPVAKEFFARSNGVLLDSRFYQNFKASWNNLWSKFGDNEVMKTLNVMRQAGNEQAAAQGTNYGLGIWNNADQMLKDLIPETSERSQYVFKAFEITDHIGSPAEIQTLGAQGAKLKMQDIILQQSAQRLPQLANSEVRQAVIKASQSIGDGIKMLEKRGLIEPQNLNGGMLKNLEAHFAERNILDADYKKITDEMNGHESGIAQAEGAKAFQARKRQLQQEIRGSGGFVDKYQAANARLYGLADELKNVAIKSFDDAVDKISPTGSLQLGGQPRQSVILDMLNRAGDTRWKLENATIDQRNLHGTYWNKQANEKFMDAVRYEISVGKITREDIEALVSTHVTENILIPSINDMKIPNEYKQQLIDLFRNEMKALPAGSPLESLSRVDNLILLTILHNPTLNQKAYGFVANKLARLQAAVKRVQDVVLEEAAKGNSIEHAVEMAQKNPFLPIMYKYQKYLIDQMPRMTLGEARNVKRFIKADLQEAFKNSEKSILDSIQQDIHLHPGQYMPELDAKLTAIRKRIDEIDAAVKQYGIYVEAGKSQTYIPHVLSAGMYAILETIAGGKDLLSRINDPHLIMRKFRDNFGISLSLHQVNEIMGNVLRESIRCPDNPRYATLWNQLHDVFRQIPKVDTGGLDYRAIEEIKARHDFMVNGEWLNKSELRDQVRKEVFDKYGVELTDAQIHNIATGGASLRSTDPYSFRMLNSAMDAMPANIKKQLMDLGFEKVGDKVATRPGLIRSNVPGLEAWAAPAEVMHEFNSVMNRNYLFSALAPEGWQVIMPQMAKTEAEAMQIVQQGLKKLEGKKSLSFFEEDPARAIAVMLRRKGEVAASNQYFENIANMFGKHERYVLDQSHYVPIKGLTPTHPLADYRFPPSIAKAIELSEHLTHLPDALQKLSTVAQRLNIGLKFFATRAWPGYWIRNYISDTYQSFLGGGLDIQSRVVAGQIQHLHTVRIAALRKGDWEAADAVLERMGDMDYKGYNCLDLYNDACRYNIMNQGRFAADYGGIKDDVYNVVVDAVKKNKITNEIYKKLNVGAWYPEVNQRLGHYMNRVSKGDMAEQAAQNTRQFLYDFSDSNIGQMDEFMEPYIWFYRWTRQNLSFFKELALTNPRVLNTLYRITDESVRSKEPISQDMLPPWMQGVVFRLKDGYDINGKLNPNYINLTAFLPQFEIFQMFQAAKHEEKTPGWGQALNLYQMVADAGMNRMLPPVKVGLELAMNRSMFNDKPIKNFDGELKKFAGISMTPETEHVLKSFRPFQTVNRIEYALENQDSIYPAVSGGLSGLTVQSVNLERTAYASRRDLTQALMKAQYALNRAEREGDITEQGRLQAIIERYQARIEQLNEHLKR